MAAQSPKQDQALQTLLHQLSQITNLIADINETLNDIEDPALWNVLNQRVQELMSTKAAVARAINVYRRHD